MLFLFAYIGEVNELSQQTRRWTKGFQQQKTLKGRTGRGIDREFVCLCFIKVEGLRRSNGMAAPICKKGKGSENNNNRPCIKKLHGENAL